MTGNEVRWICPACGKEVQTPFCAQCGEQRVRPFDMTVRGLGEKLLHAATSVDGRGLRSFWRLLRHPGALTEAYLDGDRKRYFLPFQLFVLANVLFFAVQSFTHTNIFGSSLDSHLHHQDWSVLAQELVAQRLAELGSTLEAYAPVFDEAVVLHAKSLVILMLLPFTPLLALLTLRRGRPLIAAVIFSLHLYTFLMLLFSAAVAAAAVQRALGGDGLDAPWVDTLLSLVNVSACAIYLHVALARVYRLRGFGLLLRVLLLTAAAAAIVLGYRFALLLLTLHWV